MESVWVLVRKLMQYAWCDYEGLRYFYTYPSSVYYLWLHYRRVRTALEDRRLPEFNTHRTHRRQSKKEK